MPSSLTNRDPKTGQNTPADLTGLRVGSLTVVERLEQKHKHGYYLWRAVCDCGKEVIRPVYSFRQAGKKIKSCGCVSKIGRPQTPNNGAHITALFGHLQYRAKARGLSVTLTKEQFTEIISQNCFYCGISPDLKYTHPNLAGTMKANGIDRVDSTKGYISTNVVPCCTTCNVAKLDHSVKDFREWVKRAYHHMYPDA